MKRVPVRRRRTTDPLSALLTHVARKEPMKAPTSLIVPTTLQTACGLEIIVRFARPISNYDQANLQAARLYTFIRNDDHFYAPQAAARTAQGIRVQSGWHEVDSSSLRAVKWDPDRHSLTVEFKSNRARYRYDQVPEALVANLLGAPSVGNFFEKQIKGHYPSTRLEE